jgi:hypothetical protein
MTKLLAAASLAACLAFPFLYFWGSLTMSGYKSLLAASSAAWFVFAILAISRRDA